MDNHVKQSQVGLGLVFLFDCVESDRLGYKKKKTKMSVKEI